MRDFKWTDELWCVVKNDEFDEMGSNGFRGVNKMEKLYKVSYTISYYATHCVLFLIEMCERTPFLLLLH